MARCGKVRDAFIKRPEQIRCPDIIKERDARDEPANHPEQDRYRQTILGVGASLGLIREQQDRPAKSANRRPGPGKHHLLVGLSRSQRHQKADQKQSGKAQSRC